MSRNDEAPIPELTPEEKAKVLAHFAKQFTVEKLIEYIDNDEPTYPAEQVLAEAEEWLRQHRQKRAEAA